MSIDTGPRTTEENTQFNAASAAKSFLSPETIPGSLEDQLIRETGTTHAELNGKKTDKIAPSVFTMKALPGDASLHPAAGALALRKALRAEHEAEMAQRVAEKPRASLPSSADIFNPRINR